MTNTRGVPDTVRTADAGTRMAGCCAACSICAVANEPGFNSAASFGTTASTTSERESARTDGETYRTRPVKVCPGDASTVSVTGRPTATTVLNCSGTVS